MIRMTKSQLLTANPPTSAKMISHEMWSLISMPKIRPMRNEPATV